MERAGRNNNKHGKCLVAGDVYDGDVYLQDLAGPDQPVLGPPATFGGYGGVSPTGAATQNSAPTDGPHLHGCSCAMF